MTVFFSFSSPRIPAWYRCLKVLLSLNHLILDPDLDQLLSCVWVNSDCTEIRVQRARQVLISSSFYVAYVKATTLTKHDFFEVFFIYVFLFVFNRI